MKIGAQYFTIRDYCQTIEDFDTSCKKVADIGYKTVQLSGIGNFTAEEIKPILDKYGLTVVCTHRPPQNYLDDIDAEIAFHKKLGCKICGLGAMPGFNGKAETIASFVEKFKPVVQRLAEEDLVFAYHNHAFEFEKINGEYGFDIICKEMSADNFKVILDVYWLAYAGINPVKFIREHKDNIACIHFKDLRIVDNTPVYSEIGKGNLDWDDVIDVCLECGVTDALVEHDRNWTNNNPFESLKISYDFLKEKELV